MPRVLRRFAEHLLAPRHWALYALPLAFLVLALLQGMGLTARLHHAVQDALLSASNRPLPARELALIDIDDDGLRAMQSRLGAWPYSRDVYAVMLDFLRDSGARLAVFDVVLNAPREGDRRLAQAAQRMPVVFAAAALQQGSGLSEPLAAEGGSVTASRLTGAPTHAAQHWDGFLLPAPEVLPAGRGAGQIGVISTPLDEDGVLRRLPLWHHAGAQTLPSLPLATWMRWRALDGVAEPMPLAGAPQDAASRVLLHPPQVLEGAARLRWERVMTAALGDHDDPALRAQLNGRTVFIGSTAFFADRVPTSVGLLTGVEVLAATSLQWSRGQWLGAMPRWGVALLWLLAWVPAWVASLTPRAPWRTASWLAFPALVLTAWAALHWGFQVAPMLGPLLVLALTAVLLAAARQRHLRTVERELDRERALMQASSEAKARVLAQVSHDIRTPMNALLGVAELLVRTPLSSEQQRYVDVFRRSGRQLFALIDDLLDNARLESGRLALAPHAFLLGELVQAQAELMRSQAEARGLWLRVEMGEGASGAVWGDAKRVAQILLNLLGNAVKFTHRGGITLAVVREDDERVRMRVQDTGIGIDPEERSRIFTPYMQGRDDVAREYGGSGLGLSISRQLAELMEGSLSVESAPGAGSTFELQVRLPVHDAMPLAPASVPRVDAPTSRILPLHVLVCEDNEVNRLVVSAMLEQAGHRVSQAYDGAQALAWMRAHGCDLVLMDLQMPVLDGLSATLQWREEEAARHRPRLPIIALTASADEADVQRCLAAGCDAHLAKPFLQEDLLALVTRHGLRGA